MALLTLLPALLLFALSDAVDCTQCSATIPTWTSPSTFSLSYGTGKTITAQVPNTCTQVGIKAGFGVASTDSSMFTLSVRDTSSSSLQYSDLSTPAGSVTTCAYQSTDFTLNGASGLVVITCYTTAGCTIKASLQFYCTQGTGIVVAPTTAAPTSRATTAPTNPPVNINNGPVSSSSTISGSPSSGSDSQYQCVTVDGLQSPQFTATDSAQTYSWTFWSPSNICNSNYINEFAVISDNPVIVTVDGQTTGAATCVWLTNINTYVPEVKCQGGNGVLDSTTCTFKYHYGCASALDSVVHALGIWLWIIIAAVSASVVSGIVGLVCLYRYQRHRKLALIHATPVTPVVVQAQPHGGIRQQQQVFNPQTYLNNNSNNGPYNQGFHGAIPGSSLFPTVPSPQKVDFSPHMYVNVDTKKSTLSDVGGAPLIQQYHRSSATEIDK